jgi:hypothetical protein
MLLGVNWAKELARLGVVAGDRCSTVYGDLAANQYALWSSFVVQLLWAAYRRRLWSGLN